MALYAPKACDNVWYLARIRASKFNDCLSSREGAGEELGIERTRLARIETDISAPHTDEVVMMADVYRAPELKNYFCRTNCPIGKNMPVIEESTLDRLSIRALSSLRKIGKVKEVLLDIVSDGVIDESERPALEEIIEIFDEINEINQNLKIWSQKNLR